MKKTLTAITLIALLPAGAALASDDDCSVPRDQWQSKDAVMNHAEANGWTVREIEVDDGCYEVDARDRDGRKIEVKLDPATLAVVEMEYDDDDDGRGAAGNAAPAGSVAPPKNGLFGDGAAPKVNSN
ncbi:PepSY domain-containing protein [Roseovarius sp. S1116L3]|uniref:PepSY domain-containing protein n=1 Tax=Roseovarius roseus TaxID=3342636 RepID=UPI003727D08A